MKANYETKSTNSTVELGNLYDINKQMMAQEEPMKMEELDNIKLQMRPWLEELYQQRYMMLLCHERRDYTLFNLNRIASPASPSESTLYEAIEDVLDCLRNRGAILSIEQQVDGAWECWIRNEEGCFAYYFFPYGEAVLEY